MAKKLNSLSELGLVYSTGDSKNDLNSNSDSIEPGTPKKMQKIRVVPESVRGGKFVTRIFGFEENNEVINELAKRLKEKCGVGGSVKEGEILIQGNQVLKAIEFLNGLGYSNCKKAGG
ncbi:MAG: translation initiation factor [Saprospiraceae bacterium]|nr:translation initiation factor [Saprospiraceae bacterium]